jgi:hypothetical protein
MSAERIINSSRIYNMNITNNKNRIDTRRRIDNKMNSTTGVELVNEKETQQQV